MAGVHQSGSQPEPTARLATAVAELRALLAEVGQLVKPASEWLTVDEVAVELKCSRDTITRLIEAGRLPAKNVGQGKHAAYRVRRGDLDALTVPPPAKVPRVGRRLAKRAYRQLV